MDKSSLSKEFVSFFDPKDEVNILNALQKSAAPINLRASEPVTLQTPTAKIENRTPRVLEPFIMPQSDRSDSPSRRDRSDSPNASVSSTPQQRFAGVGRPAASTLPLPSPATRALS